MDFKKYKFEYGQHRSKNIISIKFTYDKKLKEDLLARFSSVKWSSTKKIWYLIDLPAVRKALNLLPDNDVSKKASTIHHVNQGAYVLLSQQLNLMGYSLNTKRVYLAEFMHLLNLLHDYNVKNLNPKRLKDYFLYCLRVEKMSECKMNVKINAIKFFYEKVLNRDKMFFDIPRPKKPLTLPKMLSKHEVKKLFNVTSNLKHKMALMLCYGMGLRVSEVVNLRIMDIDSSRMVVLVKAAKGKKDRCVPLPETVLPSLREYYIAYKPKDYLFEGQYGGAYAKSSVQQVFKKAMRNAGIHKTIGVHGLRHSYATHLLESGADMRFIQELLGHNSIKTTQIYTKVTPRSISKIKSPLDSL